VCVCEILGARSAVLRTATKQLSQPFEMQRTDTLDLLPVVDQLRIEGHSSLRHSRLRSPIVAFARLEAESGTQRTFWCAQLGV
jgi:hypothetical protein